MVPGKNAMTDSPPERPEKPRPKAGRKKRRPSKPEILSRTVTIASFSATVRLHTVHHRHEEPFIEAKPWLELRGTLSEAIRDVRDIRISMYPEDDLLVGTARPASVGSIIQVRPDVSAVLTWPQREYDRLWSLALAGHLKFAYLAFTKPHYGSALVVSASFGNEIEE